MGNNSRVSNPDTGMLHATYSRTDTIANDYAGQLRCEFVTRTIHSAKLASNSHIAVRPHLTTFPRKARSVSKSLLANDNRSLKGHKLNRATLIPTRNSPDCNSRNIRMRARVWERAKEPHYSGSSFLVALRTSVSLSAPVRFQPA